MRVYLRAKFEVSSIILTSFRQGGGGVILPPLPPQPQTSKKSAQIRVKISVVRHGWLCPKLDQIVSQLYLKNELNYKVGFMHVDRDPWKLKG